MHRTIKKFSRLLVITGILIVASSAQATGTFTLKDYADALRSNDSQRIHALRSYILGAVETHFMYSKMLRDWTGANMLCTADGIPDSNELGALFEWNLAALQQRYGKDIMNMPILNAVQIIIEEQYSCF